MDPDDDPEFLARGGQEMENGTCISDIICDKSTHEVNNCSSLKDSTYVWVFFSFFFISIKKLFVNSQEYLFR